jgi:hypothetical protein
LQFAFKDLLWGQFREILTDSDARYLVGCGLYPAFAGGGVDGDSGFEAEEAIGAEVGWLFAHGL